MSYDKPVECRFVENKKMYVLYVLKVLSRSMYNVSSHKRTTERKDLWNINLLFLIMSGGMLDKGYKSKRKADGMSTYKIDLKPPERPNKKGMKFHPIIRRLRF